MTNATASGDRSPVLAGQRLANRPQDAGLHQFRELRASLSMPFTPETLEEVLQRVEGGQALATVESLSVKRRERKVEMTVRVLVRLEKNRGILEDPPDEAASSAPASVVAEAEGRRASGISREASSGALK